MDLPFEVGMSRRLVIVGALLALQLALALLGVLNKGALEVVPPLTLEATRRLTAGALLLTFVALRGGGLRPGRRDLIDAVVPGVIGFGFGRACVMVGLTMTSPTNVALIDSAAPAVALLLAAILVVERPSRLAIVGSLVAFGGVIGFVLIGSRLGSPNLGDMITLGSPLVWGAIYVYVASRGDPNSLLRRTAWFSLAGGLALALPGLAFNASAVPHIVDHRVLPALGLGIAVGVFENFLTFKAISVLGAVQAAEFEYLVPALTAGASLAILGLPVLPVQFGAGMIIVAGLLVAGRARVRSRRSSKASEIGGPPLAGQPCLVC